MASKNKGGAGWLLGVALLVLLAGGSWQLERHLGQTMGNRYKALTAAAEASLAKSRFDSAARYALMAIKGHDLPLIGFDDTQAEEVLALAVNHANRASLGQPLRTVQLPQFHTKERYADTPPATVWVSATHRRMLVLSGDDDHRVYSPWDIVTGTMIGKPYDLPQGSFLINTSDDNRYALLLMDGVYLYDLEQRALLPQHIPLPANRWGIPTPVYSSTYKVMITQTDDSDGFVVWDFSSETPTRQVVKQDFTNFRLSTDGRYLVLYEALETLKVWDIATRTFLPSSSLAAFKARGLTIFGGKALVDLEYPENEGNDLSPQAAAQIHGAPFILTNSPWLYNSFLNAGERRIHADGTSISVVDYAHVVKTYRIDPTLVLRGPKLVALACSRPGLKRVTPEDIAAVPSLNAKRDTPICS